MKRRLSVIMLCIMVFLQLPIHALALGGVVYVTLKSGLPGVEDVWFNNVGSATVESEEDFVNGKFIRRKFGDTVYTIYKASDPPESFGRTDLLCWKVTSVEDGSYSILRPGDTVSDHGKGGEFILEAIWDGLEHNSYAFSSPQSVTVTENSVTTRILFTLSGLSLGSAERLGISLYSGEFSDGENSIQYEYETGAVFSKIGQTLDCMIRISEGEWAKAKAGRYTAALQYDADFQLASKTIRKLHGSVPMTLQVGHDVTVSCNVPARGTASASAAMAREGETVTLAASPAGSGYGLRSWSVESGGVTVNDDNTFVMGNEDVSVTACFDPLHLVNFRNYDNSVLYSDRFFEGDTPVYKGETPVKPSTERYDYIFTGWDSQPGPVYEPKDYTAQFREEYKGFVSFNANGGGRMMANDSYYVSEGTYTLPPCGFTAPEGYLFKDWTVTWETEGGAASSATCMSGSTLTGLTGDITVSANWIELTLKASPSHAGIAEYENGAFTAIPKRGYTFDHWEYANDAYSVSPVGTVWPEDNPYQPAEVSYKIFTAVFTANEYTLTIPDSIQNGKVKKFSGTPKTGNTIKLDVTPDKGCRLASLSYTPENGTPVSITEKDANGRYFFTMPPENVTVTAVFVPVYAITTDGAAQVYCYNDSHEQVFPAEAAEGTQLFLVLSNSAMPEEGSYFTGEFTVNGTNLGREDSGDGLTSRPVNTFTMPGAAVDVAAVQAAREKLTLSFAPGETRSLPAEAWIQLQSVEGEPPLIWYDEARETKVLDVNRDGRPDLGVVFGDDARSVNLKRLADCIAFGEFTLAFSGPADRFGTIAFTIPEPPFGPASFTIPTACTSIEKSTFEETTALTVVDASHVTAIGPNAFSGCTGLTQIRLPADCAIDASAFTGCGTVFVFAPAGGTTEASCEGIANCIFVEELQH